MIVLFIARHWFVRLYYIYHNLNTGVHLYLQESARNEKQDYGRNLSDFQTTILSVKSLVASKLTCKYGRLCSL